MMRGKAVSILFQPFDCAQDKRGVRDNRVYNLILSDFHGHHFLSSFTPDRSP
jgi:hypothetical protein